MVLKLRNWWRSNGGKRRGQTMVEYAVVVAVLAIVVFASYQNMGQSVINMVSWQVNSDLTTAS